MLARRFCTNLFKPVTKKITPLHVAIQSGQKEVVYDLVGRGVKIDDEHAKLAKEYSSRSHYGDVICFFIETKFAEQQARTRKAFC